MADLTGTTLHGYQFLKPIGAGGYGMVYEAVETAVNRRVAIKVILPEHASKPQFVASFEAEARLVAQLEHFHIIPLYTYWQDEHGAFLVMRYLKGGSLRDRLREQGAFSLAQTVGIVGQIAQALHTAHQAGIIHRDLKPENILMDEHGNAYLTDFGIAKQVGQNQSATDDIKGTFAYLSPEQIQGNPVSPQTDLYALGVMVYELLCGQHPYHDVPIGLMVVKHLQEPLPSLHEQRPDLPAQIDDILLCATAKTAAARYASALELVDALRGLTGARDAAIPPPLVPAPPPPRPISAPALSDTEQRNRHAMLQNVRAFWIEGVLEHSLHKAVMIDLGMHFNTSAVDNPWNTLLRTPSGETALLPHQPIVSVFDQMNGKLLILGEPGGGKTTTLLELARQLVLRAEGDPAYPIPVIFNLSSWAERHLPLVDWLVEELNNKYQVPRKVAAEWVNTDRLLLLLDGLDEVAEPYRQGCVDTINAYRSEHGFVDLVVCSRIRDYEALTHHLRLNGAVIIQPLQAEQIEQYLAAYGTDSGLLRELIARDEQLYELARSPLMLSIMLLAYQGVSADQLPNLGDLEAQRQSLFALYVQRMFQRRIGSIPYTPQQTEHYLAWLAHQMQQHGQSLFHIEFLQPSWLPDPADKARFVTTVRSLTTLFIGFMWLSAGTSLALNIPGYSWLGALLWGVGGLLYGNLFMHPWIFGDNIRRHQVIFLIIAVCAGLAHTVGIFPLHEAPQLALLIGVMFTIGNGSSSIPYHLRWMQRWRTRPDMIVPLERVEFSFKNVQWRYFLFSINFSLSGPLIFAFLLFPSQLRVTLPALLASLFIGSGMAVIMNLYMDGFASAPIQQRLRPNEGMRVTLRNIVQFVGLALIAFMSFPLGGMVLGISFASALAMWGFMSLVYGSDTILSHGGIPLLQHLILRLQLWRQGSIPANYAAFLDHAAALILLRKVGGGYIFIHRYLLEYFAAMKSKLE